MGHSIRLFKLARDHVAIVVLLLFLADTLDQPLTHGVLLCAKEHTR